MKNPLASLYEQVLINEAEKSSLQGTDNKVGSVPSENLFGEKPKVTDTGKVKGEAPKKLDHETTSPEDPEGKEAPGAEVKKGDLKSPVPAKSGEEEAASKSKPKGLGEEFTMGAFETLFRKTLVTEEEVESEEPLEFEVGTETPSEEGELKADEETEEKEEEAESDLLSDLQDLQVRVADIITRLEQAVEEEGAATEEEGYDEEDFNEEFGEEAPEGEESEEEVKTESLKVLGDKKKALQSKNNKVGGKVTPKGGKASTGKFNVKPEIKVLGDKKKALQSGSAVKSSLKKGDSFIK